ncbi:SKP1-like protein 11 [Aristolochia californica]|uniref:SKP1-like protein 11 n=1 Tax=Aristolochia californica TaxID=171875 RepID=UPI0035DADAEA
MAAVVTLVTSDGQSVEVVQALAFQSPTLKNMIQNNAAGENRVQVPYVKSSVLKMTMEFIEKRQHFTRRIEEGDVAGREELKTWETEFLGVDQNTLIDLIEAAHFLGLKELVEVTSRLGLKELMEMASQKVADTMEGKSVAEIRQPFNIQNDYSREEERRSKEGESVAVLG